MLANLHILESVARRLTAIIDARSGGAGVARGGSGTTVDTGDTGLDAGLDGKMGRSVS